MVSRVEVKDEKGNKANILLESGPRTLRPNGKSVLELVRSSLLLWNQFKGSNLREKCVADISKAR